MKILGIDPDLHGALATWDGQTLDIADMPIVKARARGNEVNITALVAILDALNHPPFTVAYIERNSARFREGVSSSFKSGLTTGILLGCTASLCYNIVRPTPTKWKKELGLTSDKNYSRTRATELFPKYYNMFTRKKDHGRAEAALLAYFGFISEAKIRRRRLGG